MISYMDFGNLITIIRTELKIEMLFWLETLAAVIVSACVCVCDLIACGNIAFEAESLGVHGNISTVSKEVLFVWCLIFTCKAWTI